MEKKESFIVIQSFMTKELNLKGNELIIYALIHGFSQDGQSYFYGGLDYIQEQTNLARQTVVTVLQKLVTQGLLIKKDTQEIKIYDKEITGNGCVHFCLYATSYSRNVDNSKNQSSEVNTARKTENCESNFYTRTSPDFGLDTTTNSNNESIFLTRTSLISNTDESNFQQTRVQNLDSIINLKTNLNNKQDNKLNCSNTNSVNTNKTLQNNSSGVGLVNELDLNSDFLTKNINSSSCKEQTSFSPPTESEIRDYCQQHGFVYVNYIQFKDYYDEQSWTCAGQPIANWRQKCLEWNARAKAKGSMPYLFSEEKKVKVIYRTLDKNGKEVVLNA